MVRSLLLAGALFALPSPAAAQFDHSRFDRLLAAHVHDGRVDYDAFARAPEFAGYLASFAAARPGTLAPTDRLAFWINAYNAFTIDLINRNHERSSIRRIARFRSGGPWGVKFAAIGGKTYTLDDIEHGIIRVEFHEPRIHVALVCASIGCPPLRAEAYRGDALDRQLDDQALTFFARSPQKNWVDVSTRTAHLSQIFDFRDYIKDFGGSKASVGRFVAPYFRRAGKVAEADILESGHFDLKYTEYDWSLNGLAK
ncbi:MAG: DUF547 domain-containing protein [Gemmatimonadota bacterium]